MKLTDVELAMLIAALDSVVVMDTSERSTKLRLERKLNRWRDHPDLEFT